MRLCLRGQRVMRLRSWPNAGVELHMGIRAFVIALVGISFAAVYFWPSAQQPTPAVNVSSAPAVHASQEDATGTRTYSSKQPLLSAGDSGHLRDLPASDVPAKVIPARTVAPTASAREEAVVRPVASDASTKRMSSTKPGDAEAREQLVRDIQYELKRAGCYDGEMHGAWNNTTRQAMQIFTQRMNASLPVDQPDYVLLTLLQAQSPQSCKSGCPAGQVALGGRCMPKGIVSQQQGGAHLATSGQQANQDSLPGRMGAGAAMVGQDLPAAPQNQDGLTAAVDGAQPHTARPRTAPPRQRPSGYAQRGSTRQVFNNIMRNAP